MRPPAQHIDVAKLVKARPLDNLEFMQWLKSHFDSVTNNQPITDYDGPGKRAGTKSGDVKGLSGAGAGPKTSAQPRSSTGASPAGPRRPAAMASPAPPRGTANGKDAAAQLAEAQAALDVLEKEKQFYYSKLRDVELLCQTPTVNEIPVGQ